VDNDRLAGLLRDLDADGRAGDDVGARLCGACVDVLDVAGAGIMLMTGGAHQGTFGVSNDVMTVVEDLQFTLGEGPCIDASRGTRPVLEPDLDEPASVRWPAFTGPAVGAGVRAVFGFPLLSAGGSLGALDLYLERPGHLTHQQLGDAAILATVISNAVLALQAGTVDGEVNAILDSALDHRAVVHQASGMVAAQLDIGVDDALVRLRALAYTSNRSVDEVARAVVTRELHLD
jgi:hypothetical protein